MSGRDQASGAGERSSVLVSPGTLNTVSQLFRDFRLGLEPLAIGPGLQHGLGRGIALLGALGDVVEGVEHQQGVLQLFGGGVGQFGVVQQLDQGGDVVAALHGAQQLGGTLLVDKGEVASPLTMAERKPALT